MNYGFNFCWPTPILYDKITDAQLLEEFKSYILENVDLNLPPNDFQKFDVLKESGELGHRFTTSVVEPFFDRYLRQFCNTDLKSYPDYRLRSWITGAHHGYNITPHNHSGSTLSAVFYIHCEDSNGGELVLLDPKSNASRGYDKNFRKFFESETLFPKSGDVIIVPGYIYHYTNLFTGSLRLAMPVDFFPEEIE